MNIRMALGLEAMQQMQVAAVEEALKGVQPSAQTGLVHGEATETQEIHLDNMSIHEAVEVANSESEEIDDLMGVRDEMNDMVATVESLASRGLEKTQLVVALEAVMASRQMDALFQKHFRGVGMESINAMSDEEFQVALEGIIGDLFKGIENLGVRITKKIGDWWHYEANVLTKLSTEAETLLYKVKALKNAPAKKETIKVTDLHALQCNGKVDEKSLLEGFENLLALQQQLNDKTMGHFREYAQALLGVYKKTASGMDVAANRVELALSLVGLAAAVANMVSFNPATVAITSTVIVGANIASKIVPLAMDKIERYNNVERDVNLKVVEKNVLGAFEKFLKGIQSASHSAPFSGDRRFEIVTDTNNKMAQFVIVKGQAARVDSKQGVPTPNLGVVEAILRSIIHGADQFKHRDLAYEDAFHTWQEVLAEMFAGASHKEEHAIRRGMQAFYSMADDLFIEPTISLGKLQASAARSLLDYCKRAVAAYE